MSEPFVAAETAVFKPLYRETCEGKEYITFALERDETGHFTWDAVRRQFPNTLRCGQAYFGRTGWNSDRGHVYYRELYPNEVCIPA